MEEPRPVPVNPSEEPDAGAVPAETKETIPLWLAVAVTVMVALPFTLYLGKYNIPVWVSFIVWAEYFALGAKLSALKLIVPSFCLAVALTAATMSVCEAISPHLPTTNFGLYLSLFVGVAIIVYIMRFSKTLTSGSLPYFNGISMLLAVYFTASYPALSSTAWVKPWVAGCWAVAAGLLGCFLGWFNVTITFPRLVKKPQVVTPAAGPQRSPKAA
jgi:hypothetical protein